jgi:tRNA(fMet)-specific endonuclease VapC
VSYLVDSDWVADFLAGRDAAVQLLTPLAPQGLVISLMTYAEIYEGIYFGRDPAAAERTFRAFLRSVDVLPLNRAIMRRFAQIRGDLRQRGQLIGDPDILIAATALHFRLTLVTRNRQHFGRIAGLQLYPEPTSA